MTDTELLAQCEDRMVKRRMWDAANTVLSMRSFHKRTGFLTDKQRGWLKFMIKAQFKGREDWMPMGEAKYYSRDDKEYWDEVENENADDRPDKPKSFRASKPNRNAVHRSQDVRPRVVRRIPMREG